MEIKNLHKQWVKISKKSYRDKLAFVESNIDSFSSIEENNFENSNDLIEFVYELSELLENDYRLSYSSVVQAFRHLDINGEIDLENETHSKLLKNVASTYNKMGLLKDSNFLIERLSKRKVLNYEENKVLEESLLKRIMTRKNMISIPFIVLNIIILIVALNWTSKNYWSQEFIITLFITFTLILGSFKEVIFYRFLKKNGIVKPIILVVLEWIIASGILILFFLTKSILIILFFLINSFFFENEMKKLIRKQVNHQ